MRRIEVISSTMGQSSPATVAEGTGYYRFRKDPNWPEDRSAYKDPQPGVAPAGLKGSTERKQERLEKFEAALREQGYTPDSGPPARAVREAGGRAGVGYDTARAYLSELKRRSPVGGEARDGG